MNGNRSPIQYQSSYLNSSNGFDCISDAGNQGLMSSGR